MNCAEAVFIALSSLRANRLRSLLTLLGIVIGVMAVIAVVSIISGLNDYVAGKIFYLGPDVLTITRTNPVITSLDDFIENQRRKNLYLSEERSFLRKGREAVYTYFLERDLTKKRILELYLNVIEWGDGIYGAEAASRTYFKKSASDLTKDEAAFLSAMIPSPLNIFNPDKNRKRVVRRQKVILRGMNYIRLDYSEKA